MTAVSSLAFPGSRTLAGWWRQLAPRRPQALWVGHLLLHRIEALARLDIHCRIDRFTLLVLRALVLEQQPEAAAPPATNNHAGTRRAQDVAQRLADRLHLDRQLLLQVLRELTSGGLIQADPAGAWALTVVGQQAVKQGDYPRALFERRTFHFVERGPAAGGGARTPAFLNLQAQAGIAWPGGNDWTFDVGVLHACLRQSDAWKQRWGFPVEVAEILGPAGPSESEADAASAWERVVVDRPERLLVAVIRVVVDGTRQQFQGFSAQQEGWVLAAAEPAFVLEEAGAEVLPELHETPAAEVWRKAWRQWCQPRGLPANEVEACVVELAGAHLRVLAPPRLLERLRAARSDALKGEAWLLAGEGRLRAAACLEMAEGTGS